jgi:hypothetical protein
MASAMTPIKPYKPAVYRKPRQVPKYRPKTASEEIADLDAAIPPLPQPMPVRESLWQSIKRRWRENLA